MPSITTQHMSFIQRNTNQRHCSFCNKTGHNIKSCNDIRINDLDMKIKYRKELYTYLYGNFNSQKNAMYNWLISIQVAYTRAYSIRYCDGKTSQNISTHIDNIMNKIYPVDIEEENIDNNDDLLNFVSFLNQNEDDNNNDEQNHNEHNTENNTEDNTENDTENNNNNNNNNSNNNTNSLTQEITNYLLLSLTTENMESINNLVQIILNSRLNKKEKIELYYRIKNITKKQSKQYVECNICYESDKIVNKIEYNCKHSFCVKCVKEMLNTYENDTNENKKDFCCALCREKIEILTLLKINRNKNCNSKNILDDYLCKQIV